MPDDRKRKSDWDGGAVARSIAACQRCRLKKIKCDQTFPLCSKCLKGGFECVGIDPATGREVPRSYVHHLEKQVASLQEQLRKNGIEVDDSVVPPEPNQTEPSQQTGQGLLENQAYPSEGSEPRTTVRSLASDPAPDQKPPEYMGATLGTTFAKIMMAALKIQGADMPTVALTSTLAVELRTAVLAPKATAQWFIHTYFAHSNSQLPILHRPQFLETVFEPIYGSWEGAWPFAAPKSPRPVIAEESTWFYQYKNLLKQKLMDSEGNKDTLILSAQIETPEQFRQPLFYLYMVFAIALLANHLQYLNSISEQFQKEALKYVDCGLKDDPLIPLQKNLLLAVYSLMRPCLPGVWHILGQCLRSCVDLGLHTCVGDSAFDGFTRDRRRRLFWSTYSLDRQVCFYMGRPIGIPENSIKALYPLILDDAEIEPGSYVLDYSQLPEETKVGPSPKRVSIAVFQMRKMQLEIQSILYDDAELPRQFVDIDEWKVHIHWKLEGWRMSLPTIEELGLAEMHPEFFFLNYYRCLLMINGLSPHTYRLTEDAYGVVALALKNLVQCYTLLYVKKAMNYTWAAVHNLFMAGTSFLFAVYHSDATCAKYSKEDVKLMSADLISILNLLEPSCTAALSCSRLFQLLTAAVLKLRYDELVDGTTSMRQISAFDHGSPDRELLFRFAHMEHLPQPDSAGTANAEHANNFERVPRETSQPKIESQTASPSTAGQWADACLAGNDPVAMFEWVSNKDDGTKLDTLFMEMDKLSSASTVRETPAPELDPGHKPVKDGRKVFELLQLMPTESIWDQFFTNPGNIKHEE